MSFHPPIRPEPKPKVPKEWYEEYFEKDEILLYVTATLGVILPGIVYIIYQKIYTIYQRYSERKQAEAAAEEAAKREICVLTMGPDESTSANYATRLQAALDQELTKPVLRWNSAHVKSSQMSNFKGIFIIFIECLNGRASDESEWLLDWLEDVAADSKKRKNSNFSAVRFAIAAFDDNAKDIDHQPKAAMSLAKRLKILGAKPIMTCALFSQTDENAESEFAAWTECLLDELERSLGSEISEDSSTEASDSDEDEMETKKTL